MSWVGSYHACILIHWYPISSYRGFYVGCCGCLRGDTHPLRFTCLRCALWAEISAAPAGSLPPPQPPPPQTSRLTVAPIPHRVDHPYPVTSLVEYHIPLDKACLVPQEASDYFIPPGSSADPSILLRLASPTTPFEFPFNNAEELYCDFNVSDGLHQPCLMDSVTHVVRLPRVCSLSLVDDLVVQVSRNMKASKEWDSPLLMDGGANICLTGVLDLLIEVVSIAPLPISVATKTGDISLDNCCTKRGLLPLTLADGSVYYQPCYCCKNAVETIISLQAILATSEVLVRWTQTVHKDGSPGMICFDGDSGLYSISITLENHDGLYYCPTDVFMVDRDPVRCNAPIICRAVVPAPPKKGQNKDYIPVSHNRLTKLELWMLRLGSPGED
jgi:hypothetical protein